ncbi:lipase maturation factor family protein [Luteimicrobium subarcticum]|uniref:Lipase maturation factor n=1 Tax=Luteimicrobium subarcticum TaxID=620910 RepID=A0A2M8W3P3_9MICO|nr:lipase maturation factor family protein [Luteimicrobium subarcticum]PJI85551.1 lipase maturation factor [Luteimicrobium subarcticum]
MVAFASAAAQFPALLGERGLLPVPRYVARTAHLARRHRTPSLFRLRYDDRLLRVVAWTGVVLGASVVVGLPQAGPWWVPTLVLLACWGGYLSIVAVGQTFYGFGWETLLCELTFLVAWCGSDDVPVPVPVVVVLARWLLLRLELGAGLIKLRSGDPSWRDLTAMQYHQETQPMPGPLSWHAHHLPGWWHRTEVAGSHVAQLGAPLLLLAPQPVASVGALVMLVTQVALITTGNYAWLNAAAVVLALAVVDDVTWARLLPWVSPTGPDGDGSGPSGAVHDVPVAFVVAVVAVTVVLVARSWPPLRNLFSSQQLMNASFGRWRFVNAYGAFGSMTKRRFEVVVEGQGDAGTWHEYVFRGKPGPVGRRPRQVAPYHLRLDWLMWFLALRGYDDTWFDTFLGRLLAADRPTLRLLAHDPFDGAPPVAVRARLFRYRYTTRAEHRATGDWWTREPVTDLVPPLTRRPAAR